MSLLSQSPSGSSRNHVGGLRRLTGRHVLALLCGFFGVVILVNLAMTYFAISTFSGIDTDNAYVRGLAYNHQLDAAAAQKSLGWRVTVAPEDLGGGSLAVTTTFRDRFDEPISDLDVTLELIRPALRDDDRSVAMLHDARGVYRSELSLPHVGQWKLRLEAARDGEVLYHLEQRLSLR